MKGHFRGDILKRTFWKGHFGRDFLSLGHYFERHQKRDIFDLNRDFGLDAWIWALRLGSGPSGRDLGLEAGTWAFRVG